MHGFVTLFGWSALVIVRFALSGGKVLARVVCFFSGQIFLVADYNHTLPLLVFYLLLFTWACDGHSKIKSLLPIHPTLLLTVPHCLPLHSYLPTNIYIS